MNARTSSREVSRAAAGKLSRLASSRTVRAVAGEVTSLRGFRRRTSLRAQNDTD
jgi:hypothetical protein